MGHSYKLALFRGGSSSQGAAKHLTLSSDVIESPFDFAFSSVRHIVSLSSVSSSLLSSSWALFWSLFHSPPQLLSSVCICAFTTVSWHMELWPPQGTSYWLIWVSFVQFNSLKPSPVDVRWAIPIMKRDGVEPIHVKVVHRCYAYGSNNSMYNNEGEMHQCSLGIWEIVVNAYNIWKGFSWNLFESKRPSIGSQRVTAEEACQNWSEKVSPHSGTALCFILPLLKKVSGFTVTLIPL